MEDTTTRGYAMGEIAAMVLEAQDQVAAALKTPGEHARYEALHKLYRNARPMQREALTETFMARLCGVTIIPSPQAATTVEQAS